MKLLILVDAQTITLHESSLEGEDLLQAVRRRDPCLHLPGSRRKWQALRLKDLVIALPGGGKSVEIPPGLSRREEEVLEGLVDGLTTRQIAAKMFVTQPSVQRYIRGLLEKLGVTSREQAVLKTMAGDYLPCDEPKGEE
jgi:DNA-binding NarL/FixJ family response regulator